MQMTAVGIAFGGATLVGAIAPASAAPSVDSAHVETQAGKCWRDNDGRLRYWCHNRVGAFVYSHPNTGSKVVGYIDSNPSWFECNYDTGANHGGPHPTRYLYTTADNGKEGYVSDNEIIDETDPLPACSLLAADR
ncbi:hypothetical protein [Streptomyces reniochalinae]|uniref:Secreted protein n=1 Tax=Streptomyces reniochalinae TaxID=2250578 RepID=A0A367EHR7_9ACTN|nr:hypothetical protein [Streptomyces reniochalinae]RCG17638.1 hypothetical protein DQ392_17495 [Streptomyces reniochalinae]